MINRVSTYTYLGTYNSQLRVYEISKMREVTYNMFVCTYWEIVCVAGVSRPSNMKQKILYTEVKTKNEVFIDLFWRSLREESLIMYTRGSIWRVNRVLSEDWIQFPSNEYSDQR